MIMRIRMNDRRDRLYSHLEEATGEGTRSGALDKAARYYCRMSGETGAFPTGTLEDLMAAATERGSLTPEEIVEIIDAPELPVSYDHQWSVNEASKEKPASAD